MENTNEMIDTALESALDTSDIVVTMTTEQLDSESAAVLPQDTPDTVENETNDILIAPPETNSTNVSIDISGEIALEGGIDTENVSTEVKEEGFIFEPGNFVDNLQYMGIGMLGIFVVIGVIMGVTVALNKLFKK